MAKAYVFGPFRLIPRNRILLKNDEVISLGARAYEILRVLAEHEGAPVSRAALMSQVWPELTVDAAALRVNVGSLRKAIYDNASTRIVTTVTNYGYRLSLPVTIEDAGPSTTMNLPSNIVGVLLDRQQNLVGCSHLVSAIAQQIHTKRLITLHGAGGVGKTAIALEAANQLRDEYEIVCMVDLSEVKASQVGFTIARALGLGTNTSGDSKAILDVLGAVRALIILDSCERLIGDVSRLSRALLSETAYLDLIVTSRTPLKTQEEWLIHIEPLELPDQIEDTTLDQILSYPATQMFIERARASGFHSMLSDQQARYVVDVCRQLDGIPLAIDLAVPWMAAMSLRDMVGQINEALLTQSYRRQAAGRHRTLGASLGWTYDQLDFKIQYLFRWLSVFAGEFTLKDVLAANILETTSSSDISQILATLADICLLEQKSVKNAPIYRMFETTRAYARNLGTDTGSSGV